jgi:hypothetical protein
MADTKHSHVGEIPVEGDGIHYRGIVWFVGVLVVGTVGAQLLMWGLFGFLQRDMVTRSATRNPLAAPVGQVPPAPNLLSDETTNLQQFRETEEKKLSTYQWIDKNAGTVRIPIDRAKALLLERGLPTGTPAATASTPASGKPSEPADKGKSQP